MISKNSTYRSKTFLRFISVFLLFVFVQANLIKVFHQHNSENETTSKVDFIKDSGHLQLKSLAEKCDLCNFIKHQPHDFLAEKIHEICILKLKKNASKSLFITGESRAYLLSCTNKGPPSLSI
nr:hypothetical protein [uncultured Chryseobacterium sp.]